jgi:hypothetical protein
MNSYLNSLLKLSWGLIFSFFISFTAISGDNSTRKENLPVQLHLASFDIDVTPPVGHELAYGSAIKSWDLGLRAKGVVLSGAGEPILLVAIDWIGLYDACYDEFKRTLAKAAGTIPERVAVHALHQHDAPRGNIHDEFVIETLQRLELAVATSLKHAEPVTHIGYGEAEVYKVASNRRILDPNTNKVRAQRWTACGDSALRAEPEGVIDPIVSLVSFWNKDRPLAVLSFYATHPQSYYRMGIPNPDFPGIARFSRQLAVPEALHIHFTGAGGNIGAGKYNDGAKENRLILAERLADGMKRAWESTKLQPISPDSVDWRVKKVILPADTTKVNSYLFRYQAGTTIDIQCMALNNTRVLFMPGELFVEYQLAAKQMRPDLHIAMAAYGDGTLGYIPTADAYPEGGYEVEVARVTFEAEEILMEAMRELLEEHKVR